MPSLPHVPGLVRVVCNGVNGTKPFACVFHVNGALASGNFSYSQADLNAIASGFSSAWHAQFDASIANTTTMNNVQVTDLSDALGGGAQDTTARTGLQAGTGAAPEACYLINWAIARRYRGGHPRTYLPGVVESNVDNQGVIASGTVTNLTNAANAFITAINAIVVTSAPSIALAVPHFYKNGAIQASPDVDPVTSGRCNQLQGVQRRRLRR